MVIDKIYHVADIHIRNFKRHGEYQAIFNQMYEYIQATKTENSVIYLAGDIVHSKNEMTPELVSMVSNLFRTCSELLPTIIITGNHDTNLNNENRLDALTPIVQNINSKNLHYWKDSGIYRLGMVAFSVFSVYGNQSEWVLANEIEGKYKIALHHGAVNSALTDLNHPIKNDNVTPEIFKGFDLALLGDIHKRQFLNNSETVAYAGSLVQQNHAETLDKGMLVWDLKTKKSTYVPFKNKCGYVTLEIDSDKIITDKNVILNWPESIRLRVKHNNTSSKELNKIISAFKHRFSVIELTTQQLDSHEMTQNQHHSSLGDVRDVEFQNKLIEEYVKDLDSTKIVDIDGIRNINRAMNSKLVLSDIIIRNVIWKPKKLVFSNMFSFGENNVYDLERDGLQGIYGANAVGKSALLDVLTFCLYDKCTRTFKSSDMMHTQKDKFECTLHFMLNETEYVIERIGVRKKGGLVKVDVNFWKSDINGVIELLNGNDRDQTNKIIRGYIGSYDDFLLTALSSQNDNKNFVFKTQRERKELLNSFLDISIFDELHTLTKIEVKAKREYLKLLESELYSVNSENLFNSINETHSKFTHISGSFNEYEHKISEYNTKIRQLTNKITPNIKLIDIESVNKSMESKSNEIELIKKSNGNNQFQLQVLYNTEVQTKSELESYDIPKLEEALIKHNEARTNYYNMSKQSLLIANKIKTCKEQIEKLDNYKFNPDCEFCVNNEFVKSAMNAQTELPILQAMFNEFSATEAELNKFVAFNNPSKELDLARELQNKLAKLQMDIRQLMFQIQTNETKIDTLNSDLVKLLELTDEYKTQQKDIENNKKYQSEIDELDIQYNTLSSLSKEAHAEMINLNSTLAALQEKYDVYNKKKVALQDVWKEVELYDVYLNAISKDGVPHLLLEKILPVIEIEVNNILNQLVNFTVTLSTDDKNNINCYIAYDDENTWPVELSSGMERFIVSIATRVALINVTSLPRPNFLAIDEGFGVLDSDNLNSLYQLFDYLKTQFDFILIITHIDAMKDFVDDMIFITKDSNGFSKLGHE